jgi:hypothetical protein
MTSTLLPGPQHRVANGLDCPDFHPFDLPLVIVLSTGRIVPTSTLPTCPSSSFCQRAGLSRLLPFTPITQHSVNPKTTIV